MRPARADTKPPVSATADIQDPQASPCIRNCTLDDEDVCVGCGRTIGEIMEWSNASPARKAEIKAQLSERLRKRQSWRSNEEP